MHKVSLIFTGVLFSIAIIVHLFKIIYLLFDGPKFLGRMKSISNRNLNKRWLLLYYLITIGFLIQTFLIRYNDISLLRSHY